MPEEHEARVYLSHTVIKEQNKGTFWPQLSYVFFGCCGPQFAHLLLGALIDDLKDLSHSKIACGKHRDYIMFYILHVPW